jgi:CDP-glucose 4,6-dehydratase
LAERLAQCPNLRGLAFNFSNELQISVLDLVREILDRMGSTLEPEVRNEASNEIREQFLSSKKARERLGWKPRFTLDQGLQRTAAWYRKQLEDGAL